jgi:hypothetical protein
MRPTAKHLANGATLVVILVVAGFVLHSTPDDKTQQQGIAVRGGIGQELSGRNIVATVDSVRLAETVSAGNGWAGTTSGVWVVVEAGVEARVDDGVMLGTALILVDGITYSASLRPGLATIADAGMSVGIPHTGPLFFELPRDVAEGAENAELQLALNTDPRADSIVSVPLDLSALDVAAEVETDMPVWGAR